MNAEILNDRRVSITSDLTQIARDCLMFVNKNEIDKDLSNFKEVHKVRIAIQAVQSDLNALLKEVELSFTQLENRICELEAYHTKQKRIAELECELKYLKDGGVK